METFSTLLALYEGNSPVSGEFPSQRPVTQSFDFFFIYAWTNGWVNNRDAGDLRCHCAHCDITVMLKSYQGKIAWAFPVELPSGEYITDD